ncbi:MAG: dodecin family protein [Sporomusaceae bacterium]|nr:dodecin family protein [Sporomusaceae bacterium]
MPDKRFHWILGGVIVFFTATLLTYYLFSENYTKRSPVRAKQVLADKITGIVQNNDILTDKGGKPMVVKVIELVGSSPHNWTEAVNSAVAEADQTIDEITGVEATNFTASIAGGKIAEYKADVRIAFKVK